MDNTFLPLIFRLKHIKRWSLMRNTQDEDLMQHTAEVAFAVNYLAVAGNNYFNKSWDVNKLTTYAMFHDITEVLTGDLPTPIKYFSNDMRDVYKQIEAVAADKLAERIPEKMRSAYTGYVNGSNLSTGEKVLLKAADKLCAYIKCVLELKTGNKEFAHAKDIIRKQIDKIDCDELKWFIDNCMAAFEMSLDELKGML